MIYSLTQMHGYAESDRVKYHIFQYKLFKDIFSAICTFVLEHIVAVRGYGNVFTYYGTFYHRRYLITFSR